MNKDKEFWKWAGIGFAITATFLLLLVGVFILGRSSMHDTETPKPSKPSVASSSVVTAPKTEKVEIQEPVAAKEDTEEKEAVMARIKQFMSASVESRPSFLSRSTGSMAARWWKSRYDSGREITERDMPMYYWFKSCNEIVVAIRDKEHARAIVSVVVSSPWKKGEEQYTFDMVKENGKWQINDITGKSGSLRGKYAR